MRGKSSWRSWPIGDVARDLRQLRQLHRALDQGVARQDLLEQRRAGPRQADDEDWVGGLGAGTGALGEELARAHLHALLDVGGRGLRIVGMELQAQRVAACIVRERLLVQRPVLERLAERELEVQPRVAVEVRALEQRAQRRELRLAKTERLEVRQAPVRLPERRLHGDGAPVRLDGLGGAAGGAQRVPEAHPDLRLLRMLLEHALVDLDRLRVVAEIGEDRGLQEAVGGVARLAREQRLDLAERGAAFPWRISTEA